MKFRDLNGRELGVYEYTKDQLCRTDFDSPPDQQIGIQLEKLQTSFALLVDLLVEKKIISKADVNDVI